MTYHSNQVPIIKEIGGVEYEFVYNSKGTLVKKCCASCRFKQPKDEEGPQRLCTHSTEQARLLRVLGHQPRNRQNEDIV